MTRNEAILRFQERLINVAINSPRKEAMKLFGIVYSNLKEFISVRAVFEEENEEMIMDKFFDTLAQFNHGIKFKFPNLYQSLSEINFDYRDYLADLLGEDSFEDGKDLFIEFFQEIRDQILNDTMPIGIMRNGKFYHRDMIRAALIEYYKSMDWKEKSQHDGQIADMDEDLYQISTTSYHRTYQLYGDIFDVAPDISDCTRDDQYINKIIRWSSIRKVSNEDPSDEHDLALDFLSYAAFHPSGSFSHDMFATTIATSKGFAINMDAEYPNHRYSLMVMNACLVGFDEIAQMILTDMKDDEIPEVKYDATSLKDFQFFKTVTDEDTKDRYTLYRTPQKEGFLVEQLMSRFGFSPNTLRIGEMMTVGEIKKIALSYKRKHRPIMETVVPGFNVRGEDRLDKFQMRPDYAYMTIYRTGKVPELDQFINEDEIPIMDSNLKFIILMNLVAEYALTYIEVRARDDEMNNVNLYRLLQRLGGKVQCMISSDLDYKVHAKMWSFSEKPVEGKGKSVEVISTGNFVDCAQTGFCDTVLIVDNYDYPKFANFWSIKEPRTITPDMDLSKANLLYFPPTIREKIYQKIDELISAKCWMDKNPEYEDKVVPFIFIKCNHLVDPEICSMLIDAARHGVMVHILVRTSDCLPNHIDVENLVIRSIAGKYLEHDRWYCFGLVDMNDPDNPRFRWHDDYISTADIMPRNLDRRIELLALVDDRLDLPNEFLKLFYAKTDPKAGIFNLPM